MNTLRSILLGSLVLPGSWYATLAVHEFGHALAALATGSTAIDVHLPLLGFSSTARFPDVHPLLTTGAGPLAGCLLPLLAWRLAHRLRIPGCRVLQFWAGFAFVLNGSYIAGDAILLGGDSAELIRAGASSWILVICGLCGFASGLWLWHTLGSRVSPPSASTPRSFHRGDARMGAILLGASLCAVAIF